MKLQVPLNNTQAQQSFMFAHIIDSISERQRIEQEDAVPPQGAPTGKENDILKKNNLKEETIVATPNGALQREDDSMKKLIHSSIENALHPSRQSSVEAYTSNKEWSTEVKRLSAAVSTLHWELHYDSTLVERLFSSVLSNIGNPFSFSSPANHYEKGATIYHS